TQARRAGGAGGVLRIGCVPILPIDQLLRFLGALHERERESETQVTHMLARDQVRRLRDGDLDLGIFYYAEDYDDIELEPLFPGAPMAAFLPPYHRLLAKQTLGPNDLREEVLVALPRAANPTLRAGFLGRLRDA